MTDPEVEQELKEVATLVEWHNALKEANDKAQKQRYVVPNRKAKRAAARRKAQR